MNSKRTTFRQLSVHFGKRPAQSSHKNAAASLSYMSDSSSKTAYGCPIMSCSQCKGGKAVSECGLCLASLCKNCRETLGPKDFTLLEKTPSELSHTAYCGSCYAEKVAPALSEYQRLETLAQEVYFQSNKYRGNPHIISKHTKTISIEKCDDRRQLILMLAYQAAKLNYNAIIAADIRSKRIYADGGYGHYEWSGSAIPANINGALFEASTIF